MAFFCLIRDPIAETPSFAVVHQLKMLVEVDVIWAELSHLQDSLGTGF